MRSRDAGRCAQVSAERREGGAVKYDHNPEHRREGYCSLCDERASEYACCECDARAWVLNCEHAPQPHPHGEGRSDGTGLGRDYCRDCATLGMPGEYCAACDADLSGVKLAAHDCAEVQR